MNKIFRGDYSACFTLRRVLSEFTALVACYQILKSGNFRSGGVSV